MDARYEVYDDEDVHYGTRCRVALLMGLGLVVSMALAAVVLADIEAAATPSRAGGVATLWALVTATGVRWLRRLRRVVWCVKLSADEVVAFDCTRHRVGFAWVDAVRVEVHARGVVVTGPAGRTVEVTHPFRDFAAISHRLVACAEAYHLPVLVDGQPWQQLDVYALYPYLADETSLHQPSAPRSRA